MWSLLGLSLALFVAIAAWRRSVTRAGYFEREFYGMLPKTHRRYAITSLAFALYFGLSYALHADFAGIAGLTAYALVAVFYGTSFARGAADYDE
ncbi:MAG: hypothetical protein JO092_10335 [Candidatus Eremiobacteraeota bacterium]|nr:hypothetical protein [Candidatus Eremiobacteraeota bacterium]MBV8374591.1 hypothetical protein [Candidatus Eremiobacteraeota bacterium]